MPAAETAKLLASLTLQDNFTPSVKKALTGVNQLDKGFAKLGRNAGTSLSNAERIGMGMGNVIKNAAKVAVVASGAFAGFIALSLKEGQEAAKVDKLFETAVRSSGKVKGAQYGALIAQQQALLKLTGLDDEMIATIQTRLLNMKATGAQVEALTPLIVAASRATGKDTETVTMAVGKALQGNLTSLTRIGIVMPKATAASKSAAMAALEQRKLSVNAEAAAAAANHTLSKSEKAYWTHQKALVAAAIAQQKVTDATKKGGAATDSYGTILAEFQKRFGAVNQTLAGSLETRLAVLRESLANIREDLGIRLAPAITRLVDVVGSRLVPAFAAWVDKLIPGIIAGVNELTNALESGGAEKALAGITTGLSLAVDLVKAAIVPVKTLVSLFLGLPREFQTLLVGGFALNKLSGGIFGKVALEAVLPKWLFDRGSPANPLFVKDVTGGLAGGAAGATGISGKLGGVIKTAVSFLPAAIAGAIAIQLGQQLLDQNARNDETAKGLVAQTQQFVKTANGDQLRAALAGVEEQRAAMREALGGALFDTGLMGNKRELDQVIDLLRQSLLHRAPRGGGASDPMWSARDYFHGQGQVDISNAVARGTEAGILHSNLFGKAASARTATGSQYSFEVLKKYIGGGNVTDVQAYVTGQAVMLQAINKLRTPGGEAADLKAARYELGLLRDLQAKLLAKGDFGMAAKIGKDIRSLQGAINATTAAVKAADRSITSAVAAAGTSPGLYGRNAGTVVHVNVTTGVTSRDIATNAATSKSYGGSTVVRGNRPSNAAAGP